jgi:hypothetical protein
LGTQLGGGAVIETLLDCDAEQPGSAAVPAPEVVEALESAAAAWAKTTTAPLNTQPNT